MSARQGDVRWGPVSTVVAALVVVLGVCGALGAWQWSVGTHGGDPVEAADAVPLADALAPASPAEGGVGKAVTVSGAFTQADAALVGGGRVIAGVEAVLVVRPFTVAADATGTGEAATLPVVVGWVPADDLARVGGPSGATELSGYLRGSEGASVSTSEGAPDGTFLADTLSPAVFAQHWDSPMYSALLVTDTPEEGLQAIPAPEPETELNFRSIVYAFEWWLFAAFFLFVGVRWIRDNGRVAPDAADGDEPAPDVPTDAATASAAVKEGSP
ncbi:SURF1 family protein [Demequina sp. NBRC 110055]|uniref:SURF1 family protein n=1 Tax=Demequina sp. NBRC 110055 TaxID=1570344 RepID=UPI000A01E5CB|nr:SURF1 family cytochrome oxidase biogenesis protein [Demequina sp. NBRC 110055]